MLRDRFGDKVYYAADRRRSAGCSGGASAASATATSMGCSVLGLEDVISALEARALWARYGL